MRTYIHIDIEHRKRRIPRRSCCSYSANIASKFRPLTQTATGLKEPLEMQIRGRTRHRVSLRADLASTGFGDLFYPGKARGLVRCKFRGCGGKLILLRLRGRSHRIRRVIGGLLYVSGIMLFTIGDDDIFLLLGFIHYL